jgi:23S rRNA (cytosine1962-C5)-methyltransferase/23S rRNA (guanine2445-N2)-methyltransferase / 23S rRNA (guanine2069-N7)-methyltransferase
MSIITNRIKKNYKHLAKWARKNGIEAYRLYERDIPEYPYIVDIYKDNAIIYQRLNKTIDEGKTHHKDELIDALKEVCAFNLDQIIVKERAVQQGQKQYQRLEQTDTSFTIIENDTKFKVNLHDYLDTGLFLDHRPLRGEIGQLAKDKKFLNLFSYTSSLSVMAAKANAETTSVDMSKTYIEWSKENFELNDLDPKEHNFVNKSALVFLRDAVRFNQKWDLIFLDPPTFSNSKKMTDSFDVLRDQEFLVDHCMKLLNPHGLLIFSNNKRGFKLTEKILTEYVVKDITGKSIPMDFRDKKIHVCYEIRNKE